MRSFGEFLGLDTDKAMYLFVRRHYREWFPAPGEAHRATFDRQAANFWKVKEVKERLWPETLALRTIPPSHFAAR